MSKAEYWVFLRYAGAVGDKITGIKTDFVPVVGMVIDFGEVYPCGKWVVRTVEYKVETGDLHLYIEEIESDD